MEEKIRCHEYDGVNENNFWTDIEILCSNVAFLFSYDIQIKSINQPERFEWRLADILEKAANRIQNDIVKARRYSIDDNMEKE